MTKISHQKNDRIVSAKKTALDANTKWLICKFHKMQ